jgi:hypothetical protein
MSAYIGDVVKNGLVLYLDAANSKSYVSGSSTWFDLSGNSNNATLTNGPAFSADNKGNIAFDGTNDYLSFSGITLNTNTGFTIDTWIYVDDPQPIYANNWAYWYSTGNEGFEWGVYNSGSGLGFFVISDYNALSYRNVTSNYVGNTWAHLSFGCVGTTPFIYTNGIYGTSPTGNWRNTNLTITNLLRRQVGSDRYFKAKHSSIKIYNRALSPAEILENYNATKGRFDTPRAINSVQPRLVTNGLVMSLDAGNKKSYVSGSNIIYDLVPTRSTTICGTVGENGTLTLTAPPNYVFTSVDFASYGTPTGSCGSFTTSSCHSATSYTYVSSQLLGKTGSVSIGATNANFGDPCSGTLKRLYVQATVTGPSITGSLINGPTFNSSNNGSIVFDGTNDFINCGNVFTTTVTALTLDCFIKIGKLNAKQIIFSTYDSQLGWGLELYNTNVFNFFGFASFATAAGINSVTTVALNDIWHVCGVFAANSSFSIYLNGVLNNTVSTNLSVLTKNGTIPTYIGEDPDATQIAPFKGEIYHAKAYNRALSASEVLQNYNALKNRFGL